MQLKTYLTQRSQTPQAFAAEIGVTVQALYRYLSGERFPTPENLRRIREATDGAVTADDFVDQHTKPATPTSEAAA